MKNRPVSPSYVVVLAAAILLAAVPVPHAFAQSQTEVKIRLMSEALRARDVGDLAGAQRALTQLATLSPNDPAVQRLQTEIETQTAQRAAQAQGAATQPAPAPAPAPAGKSVV